MSNPLENENPYAELADLTESLSAYRDYRESAVRRLNKAVATEQENIALETGRIEKAETRIRELVKELGLA